MGMIIYPHEIYFGTFFERFNMRFGPSQPLQRLQPPRPPQPPQPSASPLWRSGGIDEIAALQRQFGIFRMGRPFLDSAALLGLGGLISSPARDRWLAYLEKMAGMESNDPTDDPRAKLNGDQWVVHNLIENLARSNPLPCFMRAHDGRDREPGFVTIEEGSPLFYLETVKFLIISLPMRPVATRPARRQLPKPRATSRRAVT